MGGLEQIDVPTVVLGGDRDTITSMEAQVLPIYEGLAHSPRHLGELVGADHFTFSNACELAPTYPGCDDPEALDVAVAHTSIRGVTTAFLRSIQGDERAGEVLPPLDEAWNWSTE